MFYVIAYLKNKTLMCYISKSIGESADTFILNILYMLYILPNQYTVKKNLWSTEKFNTGKHLRF